MVGGMQNREDQSRFKVFGRRAVVIGGIQFGLFAALFGRLYQLQVLRAEDYKLLATKNRISLRLLLPPRGLVADRNGKLLAINEKNYRLMLATDQPEEVPAVLDRLARLVEIDPARRERILERVRRRRGRVPVTVRENLSWEEVSRVEVNALDLPGVGIDVGLTRRYPHADGIAHVLGYVGLVSEQEQTGDPLLEQPGFRIGKTGFEKAFDRELRGSAGTLRLEVNAYGQTIRELDRRDGVRGAELMLSVDIDLQRFVQQRLANERSAAGVVMDCHTGEVLAMGSVPSFDPNLFTHGLSSRDWQNLLANPAAPLTNKATAGLYHPGSVFKMVVMLALLEAGIDPRETVYCPGHYMVNEDRFHCWKRTGHGEMDMHRSLAESCDVYYYEMAQRVGIDAIQRAAHRLGMGLEVGIDLPHEAAGRVPNRGWKQSALGVRWKIGDTLVAGIGQGYVVTTPLQNAVMLSRLVNGGYAVRPRLLIPDPALAGRAIEEAPPLGADDAHLALIRRAMDNVVNASYGTAHGAAIQLGGMEMGGKTGTAQVRRITERERRTGVKRNEDLPWEERDHALFVGYAPVRNPRYVASVVVEHGGGGSAVAAPIARDILIETQRRDPSRRRGTRNVAQLDRTER